MKYRDDIDKSLGVVGMALALNVWDADRYYSGVTLDAEGYDCVRFTPDYFFSGTPEVSPKASLSHQMKLFEVTLGLTLSNVMCRVMVGEGGRLGRAEREAILDAFTQEARQEFSMSDRETVGMFNKAVNYLEQVYTNGMVRQVVQRLSDTLLRRRSMTASEVEDILNELRR